METLSCTPRLQCEKCPWKKGVNPRTIPHGYSPRRHRKLRATIREGTESIQDCPIMACHETTDGQEKPCVGYLVHQLGRGNNLGLRIRVIMGSIDANVRVIGPQHHSFEDTLPDDLD